jgi:hypothetical protein
MASEYSATQVKEETMPVGTNRTRALLDKLLAAQATTREAAADSATDWIRSFDPREAAIISRVLVWLASVETDESARESQLHALAELAEHDLVPADVLSEVGQLSRTELHGSSVEHFDYLQSLRATGA